MTLTFKSFIPGVKFNLHAKYQGRRSNGLTRQAGKHTDKHIDGTDNITSSANAGGKYSSSIDFQG